MCYDLEVVLLVCFRRDISGITLTIEVCYEYFDPRLSFY